MKNNQFLRTLSKILEGGREWICSLLFPTRCPICDEILSPEEKYQGIHRECSDKLFPVYGAVCMHCGRPFRKNLRINPQLQDQYFDNSNREFCDECKKRGYLHAMSPIRKGMSLYLYQGAVKQSMYRLKYSNRREYAAYFAKQVVKQYGKFFDVDAIIPVPMYLPKQKRRGYNQAECIATELSRLTEIPVDDRLIKRVKDTTPQKELNDLERKNNLKNAFQKGKSIVKYEKVLVVDDIYTTGATIEAVAEELKRIGICRIYVLCICVGGEM